MSRLYYDDPLAAAYMAREFGVSLTEKDGREVTYGHYHDGTSLTASPKHGWASKCDWGIPTIEEPPFYIHPDSLHIFEPQEGDLVKWGHNNSDICEGILTWSSPPDIHEQNWGEIIQRNGKPFFWPKEKTE